MSPSIASNYGAFDDPCSPNLPSKRDTVDKPKTSTRVVTRNGVTTVEEFVPASEAKLAKVR